MNLHWAKTLQHKSVRYKPKSYRIYNFTSAFSRYNSNNSANDHKLPSFRTIWGESYLRRNYSHSNWSVNNSGMHAQNQFLKKTKVLSDMMESNVRSQSFTMVIVVASIFLFITLSITAAVVVFCRKRNSVFSLQKSEQDTEVDYEMDEFNTDLDYTETDFDFESETDSRSLRQFQRSLSRSFIESDCESSSPAHRPLVHSPFESEADDIPGAAGGSSNKSLTSLDSRGEYHRMTVTAHLESQQTESDDQSDNSEEDVKAKYCRKQLRRHRKSYRSTTAHSSDADSECESSSMIIPTPKVTLTYCNESKSVHSLPPHAQSMTDMQTIMSSGQEFTSSTLRFLQYDNNEEHSKNSPGGYVRNMSYDNKAFVGHDHDSSSSQPLLVDLPSDYKYHSRKRRGRHFKKSKKNTSYSTDSNNMNNNSNTRSYLGDSMTSERTNGDHTSCTSNNRIAVNNLVSDPNSLNYGNICCTAPTTPVLNDGESLQNSIARSCSTPCQLHLAGCDINVDQLELT